MKHPSQEDLLGYVLGALDAQEQREVQLLIDADPELEEKLLEIKSSLVPFDCLDARSGPRPGLARRTSERVASFQKQLDLEEHERQAEHLAAQQSLAGSGFSTGSGFSIGRDFPEASSPPKPAFTKSSLLERAVRPTSWSLSDMLVGAAAVAVVVAILLPAVSYSRFNSRVVACQNNLREVGNAMLTYSNTNKSGEFPRIPTEGNTSFSGYYAVVLMESGLLTDDTLHCPGRGDDAATFSIPTTEQINEANGCRLEFIRKSAGGDYGSSLGYFENGRYHRPCNEGRIFVVILSDMPSQNLEGHRSRNHRGYGQNLVFEDGHIAFVVGYSIGEDPIFENDRGIVAPGTHSNDNVIGPNHLSPVAYTVK